jgi:hypothetical protein
MIESFKFTNNSVVAALVIYFCALIIGCLISTALIWRPTPELLPVITVLGPYNTPEKVENSSLSQHNDNGTSIINTTSLAIKGKNNNTIQYYKVTEKTTFIPSSVGREKALLGLAVLFGAVGASVHAVSSLVTWQGKNKFERSFVPWYVTKPIIGAALAAGIYFLLRSTLLTTVSAPPISGAAAINEYGVAGISLLVGIMTQQMTQKLRDVFDSMFGIQKGTDKGDVDKAIGNNLTVIPKNLQLNINQIGALVAFVKNNVNKPISNVGVEFGLVDSNVVTPMESTLKKTDSNGMVSLGIRGNAVGKTKVHVATTVEDRTLYDTISIEVTRTTPTTTTPTTTTPTTTTPTTTTPTTTTPTTTTPTTTTSKGVTTKNSRNMQTPQR